MTAKRKVKIILYIIISVILAVMLLADSFVGTNFFLTIYTGRAEGVCDHLMFTACCFLFYYILRVLWSVMVSTDNMIQDEKRRAAWLKTQNYDKGTAYIRDRKDTGIIR